MTDPVEPGRTGRARGRHPAEAPPPAAQPEDQPQLAEGEGEAAVTEGIYFSKAPNRDVWHAYDEDHEPIGTVYFNGERWKVRVNRVDQPANFGSASAGRSFLMGWHMRGEAERAARLNTGTGQTAAQPVRALPGQSQPEGSGTGAITATGTDAGHDASTRV